MCTEKQLQVMLHVFPQAPVSTEEWERGSMGRKGKLMEVCLQTKSVKKSEGSILSTIITSCL